eukprot:COSAG01_NODE_5407_length_4281_cov_1.613196_6_plen_559_part_01
MVTACSEREPGGQEAGRAPPPRKLLLRAGRRWQQPAALRAAAAPHATTLLLTSQMHARAAVLNVCVGALFVHYASSDHLSPSCLLAASNATSMRLQLNNSGTCGSVLQTDSSCMADCPNGSKIPVMCNRTGQLSVPANCCGVGEGWDGQHGSQCRACPAGSYAALASKYAIACLACETGKYQPFPGQTNCLHCPAGKYGLSMKQTSPTACISCRRGTTSDTGASSCDHCLLAQQSTLATTESYRSANNATMPAQQLNNSGTCGLMLKSASTCVASCTSRGSMPVHCSQGKVSVPANCCSVGEEWDGRHGSQCSRCLPGTYNDAVPSSCRDGYDFHGATSIFSIRLQVTEINSSYGSSPVGMRIRGGGSRGVLEMRFGSHKAWDAVCDDSFDDNAAKAICKDLGFDGNNATHYVTKHGDDKFAADDIRCPSGAASFVECSMATPYSDDCGDKESVGIDCGGQREANQTMCPCSSRHQHRCSFVSYRSSCTKIPHSDQFSEEVKLLIFLGCIAVCACIFGRLQRSSQNRMQRAREQLQQQLAEKAARTRNMKVDQYAGEEF